MRALPCAALLFASLAAACTAGSTGPGGPVGSGPSGSDEQTPREERPAGGPSDSPAATPLPAFAVAARTVLLGDTLRGGGASTTAWRTLGENLDGIVSDSVAQKGECRLRPGAAPAARADGNDGIDNAWGRLVVPALSALFPLSKSVNDSVAAGAETFVLSGGADGLALSMAAPAATTKWDGTDVRLLAQKTTFSKVELAGDVLRTGPATSTFELTLRFDERLAIVLPIRHARVSMSLSADKKAASNGIIAGVIATADLEAALAGLVVQLGESTSCSNTMFAERVRQASDILIDGTQDPARDCDGVSIGIGFDASAVAAGGAAPKPTAPVAPCR